MASSHVRDQVKLLCELSYKVFKEQGVYDPLLVISPFTTIIKLTDFIGGIQRCVPVVGR